MKTGRRFEGRVEFAPPSPTASSPGRPSRTTAPCASITRERAVRGFFRAALLERCAQASGSVCCSGSVCYLSRDAALAFRKARVAGSFVALTACSVLPRIFGARPASSPSRASHARAPSRQPAPAVRGGKRAVSAGCLLRHVQGDSLPGPARARPVRPTCRADLIACRLRAAPSCVSTVHNPRATTLPKMSSREIKRLL